MIARFIRMIFVGLCFALPFGLVTAVAQAQTLQPPADGECQDCHEITQVKWANSAHGQALSSPTFQATWQEKGSPAECLACHTTGFDPETGTYAYEGVSCSTCHSSDTGNHPDEIMPTDVSSRMCGECHLDTYAEWETSTHGAENQTCATCHDVHSTSIKAAEAQELCQSCHLDEVHYYQYTSHSEEGLLCTDCHVNVSGSIMGEGHAQRKHTFTVDLNTCNECHSQGLHYPSGQLMAEAGIGQAPQQSGLAMPIDGHTVVAETTPSSPFSFAILAALVGMAVGMVISPLLERWYRRNTSL